jgi:hypothetical protein
MAQVFRCRPSELLGLSADSYLSFSMDRAVWSFGVCVEKDMADAEDALPENADRARRTAARLAVFNAYMQTGDESSPVAPVPKGRFADPMVAIRAKMATQTGR